MCPCQSARHTDFKMVSSEQKSLAFTYVILVAFLVVLYLVLDSAFF